MKWYRLAFVKLVLLLLVLVLVVQTLGSEAAETARLAPKYGAIVIDGRWVRPDNPDNDKLRPATAWDRSRVDLLTATHAIEVEWAYKWKEAVGQSLYYSILYDKKPGIILLRKRGDDDERFIYRCQSVCARYGIALWIENAQDTDQGKVTPTTGSLIDDPKIGPTDPEHPSVRCQPRSNLVDDAIRREFIPQPAQPIPHPVRPLRDYSIKPLGVKGP